MDKGFGIPTIEIIRYLKYHGPVHVRPKVISQEAFDTWAKNMKVVDYK